MKRNADVQASRAARVGVIAVFALVALLYLVGFVLVVRARAPVWPDFFVSLGFAAFPVVGLLIGVRRPRNRIAWLCLALGFVWGMDLLGLATAAHAAALPGLIDRPDLVLAFGLPLWLPGFILMGFLLLLFPDGSLPGRQWRPVAWSLGVLMVVGYVLFVLEPVTYENEGFPDLANPLGVEPLRDHPIFELLVGAMAVLIVASAVALVRRFRQSSGVERLQLKWLVASGAVAAMLILAVVAAALVVGVRGGDEDAVIDVGRAMAILFAIIPVSIGMAVLRYRLYDIDRIVSRTVSYGLVAGLLGAVFVLIAIGVPQLLGMTGDAPPLLVAGATLAVAGLFNPLRRRVHARVDRRFNRARYDALQVADVFAERLRADLEIGNIAEEMLEVVSKTMQPVSASLWIREDR